MRTGTTVCLLGLVAILTLLCSLAETTHAEPLPGYSRYRIVTVAPGTVAGVHTNEVVGFFLDPSDYPEAMPGGTDLRFTNASGTLLHHELASWTASEALFYFKADVLAVGSQFLVFYGNPDSTSTPPVRSTWSKWAAVYHFEEDPTTRNRLTDSSGNGIHGSLSAKPGFEWSSASRVPGAVGHGWDYETQRVTTLRDIDLEGAWTTFVIHKNTENKNQNTGLFTYHNHGFYWDMANRGDITIKTLEQTEPGFWLRGTNITGPINDGSAFVYLALRHDPGVDGGVEFFSNGARQTTRWDIMDGNPWTPLGVPVNANLDLVGTGRGAAEPFGLSSASYNDNASDGNDGISDEQWIYDGLADDDYIALLYENLSDNAAFWTVSNPITIPVETDVDHSPSPRGPVILSVSPNPFNPRTTISFEVPAAGDASVRIVDVAGRLIRRVFLNVDTPGTIDFAWDGKDDSGKTVAGGVYVVRIETHDGVDAARVTLLK